MVEGNDTAEMQPRQFLVVLLSSDIVTLRLYENEEYCNYDITLEGLNYEIILILKNVSNSCGWHARF